MSCLRKRTSSLAYFGGIGNSTGGELGDGRPGRLDRASQLGPEDSPPRSREAADHAADERFTRPEPAIGPVHGRGVHPDQDLVRLGGPREQYPAAPESRVDPPGCICPAEARLPGARRLFARWYPWGFGGTTFRSDKWFRLL